MFFLFHDDLVPKIHLCNLRQSIKPFVVQTYSLAVFWKPWLFSASDILCFPSADFLNLSLQKLPFNGQCVSIKKHLKWQSKGDGVRLFLVVPSDWTRGNGLKLEQEAISEHKEIHFSCWRWWSTGTDCSERLSGPWKLSEDIWTSWSFCQPTCQACQGLLWMTEIHQRVSATPPSFVSPVCWGFTAPSSRSLIKTLNKTRPSIDLGGAPAEIGFQLDFVLLILLK